MINRLRQLIIIIFIFIPSFYAQNVLDINKKDYLDSRPAEVMINRSNYNYITVSKYLPVFQLDISDNWFSTFHKINFSGVPFDVFPLNFNSVELVPVDQINFDKILVDNKGFYKFNNKTFSGINFVTSEIPDSFNVILRGYFGSETGDPLIYNFTRSEDAHANVNKTPPSGSAEIAGKSNKLSYRFNAGYYGHFSTGTGNTGVLSYRDSYFINKQNKQIWGSLEAGYDLGKERSISLNGSIISYYGWDAPPFISNYIHFESYLYRMQAVIKNIPENFSLLVTNDRSITESHRIRGIPPFKFELSDYSFNGFWYESFSDITKIILNGDFKIHSAQNSDLNDSDSQLFFEKSISEYSYGLNLNFEHNPFEFLPLNFIIDYHQYDKRLNAFSYEACVSFLFNKNISVKVINSSRSKFPNLTELYGKFMNFNPEITSDTLRIKGNNSLHETRVNYSGLVMENYFPNFTFSVEAFMINLRDPIEQITLRSTIFENTGELLRNAVYINGTDKKALGFKILSDFNISDNLNLTFHYSFNENKEAVYYPKHKIFLSAGMLFPFGVEIKISYHYKSRTEWKNFYDTINDRSVVPSGINFNLFFNLSMGDFYYAKDLILSARILNIFNSRNYSFPFGNNQDRTLIFSMALSL